MNKNIFKVIALVAIAMIVGEIQCSQNVLQKSEDDKILKQLQSLEKAVNEQITIGKCLRNMFRLSAYAEEVDGSLPNVSTFIALSNDIEDKSPLNMRREMLRPFYSSDSKQAIKKACMIKNAITLSVMTLLGAIGYYFYSKNK